MITGMDTGITAFVGQAEMGPAAAEVAIHSFNEYCFRFGGLNPTYPMSFAVSDFFANGGTHALILRLVPAQAGGGPCAAADPAPPQGCLRPADYFGSGERGSGMNILDGAFFDLLCLPPDTLNGSLPEEVLREAARICQRNQALLILDPPKEWERLTLRDLLLRFRNTYRQTYLEISSQDAASHAALFFPRLRRAESTGLSAEQTWVPCGAVAGVLARIARESGVWVAPTGLAANLTGFSPMPPIHWEVSAAPAEFNAHPTLLEEWEAAELSAHKINCICSRPGDGLTYLATAQTLSDQPDWRQVATRQLANYIEKSISVGLKAEYTFSANQPATWQAARQAVAAFLTELCQNGAFGGRPPAEVFSVECGLGTTMTGTDLLDGYLRLSLQISLTDTPGYVTIAYVLHVAAP